MWIDPAGERDTDTDQDTDRDRVETVDRQTQIKMQVQSYIIALHAPAMTDMRFLDDILFFYFLFIQLFICFFRQYE